MTMGEKIQQLRRAAGLSQEQLATQLGVSHQSVSKWETGATMPDILLLPVLAAWLLSLPFWLFERYGRGQ